MSNIQEEIWKSIPGFEGLYEVSDQGRVKSIFRRLGKGTVCSHEHKLIKLCKEQDGYLVFNLHKNGKRRMVKVHRIVMLTFIGCSDLQVDHINGIKDDNRIINLRYVTCLQNIENHHSKLKNGISVGINKARNKWLVNKTINGNRVFIGSFTSLEDAELNLKKALI